MILGHRLHILSNYKEKLKLHWLHTTKCWRTNQQILLWLLLYQTTLLQYTR